MPSTGSLIATALTVAFVGTGAYMLAEADDVMRRQRKLRALAEAQDALRDPETASDDPRLVDVLREHGGGL